MAKNDDSEQFTYPGEKARQGEIILRTRARRIIFIAGLVGLVVLAIVMQLAL
ncbi:peptide ABC transporter permease [Mesorhizobium sp. WSM2239]